MSVAVSHILAEVGRLTAAERAEFLSLIAAPSADNEGDWTDDDSSRGAAQTFVKIDADEEEGARLQSIAQ